MRKLHFAFIPLLAVGVPLGAAGLSVGESETPPPIAITVYKTPQCGCCRTWVDHLRKNGFEVTTHDVDDIAGCASRYCPNENHVQKIEIALEKCSPYQYPNTD